MSSTFDLQGHRGARGLKPENTLPAFEAAFDVGVTTVETDIHLSRDGVPVIVHDAVVSDRIFRRPPGGESLPDPAGRPLVRSLTLAELRGYRADRNPDPGRFTSQDASVTPLTSAFARHHGIDPYSPPTLTDLFAFAAAYAGQIGGWAGKTEAQRDRARGVHFDLELKRVPFRPERIGDDLDGAAAGDLERALLACVRAAGVIERTIVRSFDHRCVRALLALEPRLTAAVLVAGTAPIAPEELARAADAQVYCPEFEFLDERQVKQAHAAGIRVVPWTVNEEEDWKRLIDWGVDGITTDYPDRLAVYLSRRGIEF